MMVAKMVGWIADIAGKQHYRSEVRTVYFAICFDQLLWLPGPIIDPGPGSLILMTGVAPLEVTGESVELI